MAKKVRTQGSTPSPSDWNTDWPKDGDLRQWLLCWLRKCDTLPDFEDWWNDPHGLIEYLMEMGEVTEALSWVDRLLSSISAAELDTVDGSVGVARFAEQGAEICSDAGDLTGMERYLALIIAKLGRKGGFALTCVRKFRAEHGLLDPQDGIDAEERNLAAYTQARRRFHESRGKAKAGAIADMERFAQKTQDMYDREDRVTEIIKLYIEQGNSAEVQRLIKRIPKDTRDDVLERSTLCKLGMKREAIARSKREIAKRRRILAGAGPSDYRFAEFQIRAICREVVFLAEQKEKPLARREFALLLKGAASWRLLEARRGTPNLVQCLADTISAIDGPKAARAFLDTHQDGSGKARSWKELTFDEALANARKIRSPAKQRFELSLLLAQAGRWQDLTNVLSAAATPKEARELCSLVVGDLRKTTP